MEYKYDPILMMNVPDEGIKVKDAKTEVLQTKNGYTLGINDGKIVLAFKGETLEHPHMWLGEANQSNMNKAVKLFEELANSKAKDAKAQDISRGHEIIVKTENYLKSIGKNNSVGKYDKVVRGVKSLLEQGFLEGPELEKAIKQEADRLLKKYSLDAAIEVVDANRWEVTYEDSLGDSHKKIFVNKEAVEKFIRRGTDVGKAWHLKVNGKPVNNYATWTADSNTVDSSVNDFSSADVKAVFDYVDRQFTKDMNEYSRRIANAKTQEECERIEDSIRKDLDNIADEYIQIWNQVGQYAQKRKNDAVTRYGELMRDAFRKYNELMRGK